MTNKTNKKETIDYIRLEVFSLCCNGCLKCLTKKELITLREMLKR